jgi:hypothetical protein
VPLETIFFHSSFPTSIHLPASLRSSDHYSPSVHSALAAYRFACATTDALTAALCGSSFPCAHDMNAAPYPRQLSRVTRSSRRPPFHHQPPDKPQQRPFSVLGESHWFRSRRTWLRSGLAVSPTCLAESCSLVLRTGCLALGCSRPRLSAPPLLYASCSFTVKQCRTFTCGDKRSTAH